MYLLGDSISKIAQQFPQYPIGQIALTAALRGWVKDRDRTMHTLQDRVRAKVVKSVLDQVDFLTQMMAVANAEHLEAMIKYVQDPINNPKPPLRVTNIKEYKDVAETLYKIVAGATGGLIPGLPGYKETGIERATREAGEQAKANAEAAAAEKERLRLQGIADFMTASVNARRLRPGSAQTTGGLLSASSSGTLLSTGG